MFLKSTGWWLLAAALLLGPGLHFYLMLWSGSLIGRYPMQALPRPPLSTESSDDIADRAGLVTISLNGGMKNVGLILHNGYPVYKVSSPRSTRYRLMVLDAQGRVVAEEYVSIDRTPSDSARGNYVTDVRRVLTFGPPAAETYRIALVSAGPNNADVESNELEIRRNVSDGLSPGWFLLCAIFGSAGFMIGLWGKYPQRRKAPKLHAATSKQ